VENAYLKIDVIMVAYHDFCGSGTMADPNASRPSRLSVLYVITSDKGSSEIIKKGGMAITFDESVKDKNIYEIAYGELKVQVPELKDATDDI
jgi:hypothetical protein